MEFNKNLDLSQSQAEPVLTRVDFLSGQAALALLRFGESDCEAKTGSIGLDEWHCRDVGRNHVAHPESCSNFGLRANLETRSHKHGSEK